MKLIISICILVIICILLLWYLYKSKDSIKISVSFLKSKFDKIETIKRINETNCEYIHVDVMDGIFVENKTENLAKYLDEANKKLDVHLMVKDVKKYINIYKKFNPEYITIHAELTTDLFKIIEKLKKEKIKVGIALNPQTKVEDIKEYLPLVDQVLVMSVKPGAGGQKFMNSSLDKIYMLDKLRHKNKYRYKINVDGGIDEETVKLVKTAGVDMCVSGSFICMSDDYQKQIDILKKD